MRCILHPKKPDLQDRLTVVPDLSKGLTVDTWAIRSLLVKSG